MRPCTERGRWIRCSVIPHQLHKLINRSVSGQSAEHRRAHPIAISTRAGCTSSVPVCRTCTTNQFMAHWRSRRARRNTGDRAAAPPERCGDGNTNPDPSSSGLTSRSSATASTDSGTRCIFSDFMRSAGIVQVAASKSISSQVAPRASPDRQAVSTTNRKQAFAVSDARPLSMAFSAAVCLRRLPGGLLGGRHPRNDLTHTASARARQSVCPRSERGRTRYPERTQDSD